MSGHSMRFEPFAERMRAESLPALFIETFAGYYRQLVDGETGMIPEASIEPIPTLSDADELPGALREVGEQAMPRTVVIKLNGGLGTSMGLARAKSLLEVRDGLSFLDIVAHQAASDGVPLVLMNSFATEADSLAALAQHSRPVVDVPVSFVQHKAPKIRQADLSPADYPPDRALEWCPPGHGDLYTALLTSGTLDSLLRAGYEFAFVSNGDNLGAVLDRGILGHFVERQRPFMMEVARRTAMDRKGGHLAKTHAGQLILRETAQCPPDDKHAFTDIARHPYFNTNNLWLNLRSLQQALLARNGRLGLPMIRNSKTVNPRDPDSAPVYQLETAMGSAIAVFEGAHALEVPRSRFAPVKHTEDLVAVRSDAYELTGDYRIVPAPQRGNMGPLVVILDPEHYAFASDLAPRFPYGVPSCVRCSRLTIHGDVGFGRDVVLEAEVTLFNRGQDRVVIPDGARLTGEHAFKRMVLGSVEERDTKGADAPGDRHD